MNEKETAVEHRLQHVVATPTAVGAAPRTTLTVPQSPQAFLQELPSKLHLVLAQSGKAYAVVHETSIPHAVLITSRAFKNYIRKLASLSGIVLRNADVADLVEHLQTVAETEGKRATVWYRVAAVPDGIEIDIGDESHERYRITPNKVQLISQDAGALFYRTSSCQPICRAGDVGDIKLLRKYVNLDATSFFLFVAWLSYTLANPKQSTSKYVILVLQGGEGSGKSKFSRVALQLLDPTSIGVQHMPGNVKDLAIACQGAHVLCFDNLRSISPAMADALCMASTGGAITGRQLYTDSDQQVQQLHCALILNGIHSFVDQPDLAQRCLPLRLQPLPASGIKSESTLAAEFQQDLPAIMRGLFDLVASVLAALPNAVVTDPERMIDFVRWLAAMEVADGTPTGCYQGLYSSVLNEGQLEGLMENLLASAIIEFAPTQSEARWHGTPTELLNALNFRATAGTQRSRQWPQNPIALSKRLLPLQAGLRSQGIVVELTRGKNRTITIETVGGSKQ